MRSLLSLAAFALASPAMACPGAAVAYASVAYVQPQIIYAAPAVQLLQTQYVQPQAVFSAAPACPAELAAVPYTATYAAPALGYVSVAGVNYFHDGFGFRVSGSRFGFNSGFRSFNTFPSGAVIVGGGRGFIGGRSLVVAGGGIGGNVVIDREERGLFGRLRSRETIVAGNGNVAISRQGRGLLGRR